MSGRNDIVAGEEKQFVTLREEKYLGRKKRYLVFAGIVFLVNLLLIAGLGAIFGLKNAGTLCIICVIIITGGSITFGIADFLTNKKSYELRKELENSGIFLSAKVKQIKKIRNAYTVCVDYEENGIEKEWTSLKYGVNPENYIFSGANAIIITNGDKVCIDKNQVKKTVFLGDWLEHYSENSEGKVEQIPEEQKLREWVGEGPDPTLSAVRDNPIAEISENDLKGKSDKALEVDQTSDYLLDWKNKKRTQNSKILLLEKIVNVLWIITPIIAILLFGYVVINKNSAGNDKLLIGLFLIGVVLFACYLILGNIKARVIPKYKMYSLEGDSNSTENSYAYWDNDYERKIEKLEQKISRYERGRTSRNGQYNNGMLVKLVIIIAVISIIVGILGPVFARLAAEDFGKFCELLFIVVLVACIIVTGIIIWATSSLRYKRNVEKLNELRAQHWERLVASKKDFTPNFKSSGKKKKVRRRK